MKNEEKNERSEWQEDRKRGRTDKIGGKNSKKIEITRKNVEMSKGIQEERRKEEKKQGRN